MLGGKEGHWRIANAHNASASAVIRETSNDLAQSAACLLCSARAAAASASARAGLARALVGYVVMYTAAAQAERKELEHTIKISTHTRAEG